MALVHVDVVQVVDQDGRVGEIGLEGLSMLAGVRVGDHDPLTEVREAHPVGPSTTSISGMRPATTNLEGAEQMASSAR